MRSKEYKIKIKREIKHEKTKRGMFEFGNILKGERKRGMNMKDILPDGKSYKWSIRSRFRRCERRAKAPWCNAFLRAFNISLHWCCMTRRGVERRADRENGSRRKGAKEGAKKGSEGKSDGGREMSTSNGDCGCVREWMSVCECVWVWKRVRVWVWEYVWECE